MKGVSKFLLVIVLLVTTSSCKKFLDEELLADYPETAFFKTEAHAILAINAAYQPLTFSSDKNRLWVFGDVASDDAAKGGDPGDQADIGNIDEFNIYPINGNVESVWSILYDGINRCNVVLQKVPAIAMNKELQTRILGEARFLRAYYYFLLVNIYGPVPVILEPKNANELQIEQSPVSDIYANVIEKDCQEAINSLLPTYTGSDVGRATKGAATALLAKAYLYQGKWAPAAETAAQVVTIGGYELMPVFQQNFNEKFKNNKESIFEIQHLTGQVPFLGNRLNQWFAPRTNEGGYFFDVPTQSFVDEFEVTPQGVPDPRLDYTVGREGHNWFDGVPYDPIWSPTGYLQKKNVQPLSEIPKNVKGDGNLNYLAIRLADVLLWQAEALNEQGKPNEALVYVNQVRKRARESYLYDTSLNGNGTVPAALLPDVTVTNREQLRAAIYHERRVELGFEFHRYFDLMRWGKDYAKNALKDKPSFNYDINRYFPIPQSERDTNKKIK